MKHTIVAGVLGVAGSETKAGWEVLRGDPEDQDEKQGHRAAVADTFNSKPTSATKRVRNALKS